MRLRVAALSIVVLGLVAFLSCTEAPTGRDAATIPERVVVLAPAAAEMLESLGLLDRVVAVGAFGPWPGNLGQLPVAGGYASPNVEVVLGLEADAVLTADSAAAEEAHGQLESLGVRVVALDTRTYEGVFASLGQLGDVFDLAERAREVEAAMRTELREIEQAAADLEKLRVLFVVGRDPLYVAGPGSHIDQMIVAAGGENVAGDVMSTYQQMSLESVLERMPEIIVDTSSNAPDAPRGRIPGAWADWEFLPAVQADRVYQVHPSQLVIPGMRLPAMTELMARLIHPEAFGEPEAASYSAVAQPAGHDAAAP